MPAWHHRVTRGEDYRRVVRTGNRVGGASCITYAVRRSADEATTPPARFGYIISKAVGNAVTRNLVRRRMKFISDELLSEGAEGMDIVFRALPRAATASFADMRRDMRRAYDKLRSQS